MGRLGVPGSLTRAVSSHKRLKSLAHNVAHSYFSVMTIIDGKIVLDDLIRTARLADVLDVRLDVLTGEVVPAQLNTELVAKSLAELRRQLPLRAEWEECDFEAIESFVLEIHIRFHEPPEASDSEKWDFDAKGVIVDDRGVSRSGSFRYGGNA